MIGPRAIEVARNSGLHAQTSDDAANHLTLAASVQTAGEEAEDAPARTGVHVATVRTLVKAVADDRRATRTAANMACQPSRRDPEIRAAR